MHYQYQASDGTYPATLREASCQPRVQCDRLTQTLPVRSSLHSHPLIDNRVIEFVDHVNEGLSCAFCHRPAISAFLSTICGCRVCQSCESRLFRQQTQVQCPGPTEHCATPLTRHLLKPDKGAQRDLNRKRVRCPKKGCGQILALGELGEHLSSCKYPEPDLDEWLDAEEIRWRLKRNDLPYWRQICLMNRLLHLSSPAPVAPCGPDSRSLDTWLARQKLTDRRLQSLEKFEEENPAEVTERQNQLVRRCADAVNGLTTPPPTIIHSFGADGITQMKIRNFQRLRRQIIEKTAQDGLNSEVFYKETSLGMYKVMVRVYVNGCSSGQGSHLSVFIVLMAGPHDAILRWPFSRSFEISLLSQKPDSVANITSTVQPNTSSAAFQRPSTSKGNTGGGNPRLVPLEMLQPGSPYISNDTVFVRVKIN